MYRSVFLRKIVLFLLVLSCTQCHGVEEKNPFLIDFPVKQELSREDYIEVQARLRKIDIEPVLKENFVADEKYTSFEDLERRCCRGVKQVLIDPENNEFPIRHLEKIGSGGDNCIVCYVSIDPEYVARVKTIPDALREVGFNGYILYLIGGYPNPSGKEIQYAGVPYAFKIFVMLEAKKLGFNKVIWLDSSLLPIRDPTPLFKKIEEEESLVVEFYSVFNNGHFTIPYNERFIFPKTRALLLQLTGVDVVNRRHISTAVLGLKMDAKKVEKFVDSYYAMVAQGTPFISCFPEEFVFSSLMDQSPTEWPGISLFSAMFFQSTADPKEIANLKAEQSVFFYLRNR